MLKARSKSKLKESLCNQKKVLDEKSKKYSRQMTRRIQQQQNTFPIPKLNISSIQSKKKLKNCGVGDILISRQHSPLNCNKNNGNGNNKLYDENFIQKLFDKNYNTNYCNQNFFLEQLIEKLISKQNTISINKGQNCGYLDSVDFNKSLHLKNQQIAALQNEVLELKLNISNFILKVFDLTVLCRKYSNYMTNEIQNLQFNKKTDEVIAYLDLVIKRWKLQQKIKNHCQGLSKKNTSITKNKNDNNKRCYTQSLKIPLQQYLESLQNTQLGKFDQHSKSGKKQDGLQSQEQSQDLMKIVSKRSSGVTKQEQDIYVVIRAFEGKNQHELSLKVGQRVSILQKNQHNKWVGLKDGKVGYFPHQCLF